MSDGNSRGTGPGAIFVAVVVGGSAVGVVGWYLMVNRGSPSIDSSGFDLSAAPHTSRPAPVLSAPVEAPQASSLAMLKGDAGVRIGDSGPAPAQPASQAKEGDKKEQAHADFTQEARKHESDVRNYSMRMTQKYPILRQYGRDWMSHPDLKKLNDDYMRDHDPIAFMAGLSRAPSFPLLLKQYAGKQEILGFVVQGLTKEAPHSLVESGLTLMREDASLKPVITQVETAIGMTPEMADKLTGGSKKAASN